MDKWNRSGNYGGKDYSDCYMLYAKTRDSRILAESNFDAAWEKISEGREDSETVFIAHFRHWGCGWIECIMIHESDREAVMDGEDIWARLDRYAVLDDLDFCRRESEYAQELWDEISLRERIEYCDRANESIFAARHNSYPVDVGEYLTIDA